LFQGPTEYTVTLSPSGKVVSAKGLPDNLNLNQLQVNFPDFPVKQGHKWEHSFVVQSNFEIPMKAEYKFEEIVEMNGVRCAKIKSEVVNLSPSDKNVKLNTKATGVIYFDWKNGRVVKNVVTSFMDLRMPANLYGEDHVILVNMFMTMIMELK
jgi:hypothetical protein